MKKTDKIIDKALRGALTEVCEIALDEVNGFKWLTHVANYSHFPDSLSVVCVFATKDDLSNAMASRKDDYLCVLIKDKLAVADIHIKNMREHVRFEIEEV